MKFKESQGKLLASLHQEALKISKEFRKQEIIMIQILQKIDAHKVFRFIGYKSLFQYALSELKLSKDQVYTFITVARKARSIEKLQKALENGSVSISKARRIVPVI